MFIVVVFFSSDIPEFYNVVGNEKAVKLITASKSVDMPLHRIAMKDAFESMMMRDKSILNSELRKWVGKIMEMGNYFYFYAFQSGLL